VLPSCSVGATGAAQGATFGISLGGAKESKWCEVYARTALIGTLGIDGSHKADCYLAAKDPDYAGQLAALEGADYCTVRIVDAPAPVSAVSAPPSAAVVETPEERGERG
jgi:hypothetical protein